MIDYKTTRLGSPRTMIGYAVVIRLLPVTLVLASMAAATVIGLRFIRALRMGTSRYRSYRTGTKHGEGYKKFVDEEDGGVELGGAATAAGDDNGVLDVNKVNKEGSLATMLDCPKPARDSIKKTHLSRSSEKGGPRIFGPLKLRIFCRTTPRSSLALHETTSTTCESEGQISKLW